MLGIHDKEFDILGLQQIDDPFPKNACAFHGYMRAAVLFDPVDPFDEKDRVGAKRLNLLSFRCNDTSSDGLLVNIICGAAKRGMGG